MNPALAHVLDLELLGDAGAVFPDLARDNGIDVEVITNDEAEHRRVKFAACDEYLALADPIPYAPRWVRCGGLRAVSPSEGGDLKGWMAARVARLWRRRRSRVLFRYVTKRGNGEVAKTQRWETRDYVTLAVGDSAAHLSGFPPSGPKGRTYVRGVSGPRRDRDEVDADEVAPLELTNRQFDFTEGP